MPKKCTVTSPLDWLESSTRILTSPSNFRLRLNGALLLLLNLVNIANSCLMDYHSVSNYKWVYIITILLYVAALLVSSCSFVVKVCAALFSSIVLIRK